MGPKEVKLFRKWTKANTRHHLPKQVINSCFNQGIPFSFEFVADASGLILDEVRRGKFATSGDIEFRSSTSATIKRRRKVQAIGVELFARRHKGLFLRLYARMNPRLMYFVKQSKSEFLPTPRFPSV